MLTLTRIIVITLVGIVIGISLPASVLTTVSDQAKSIIVPYMIGSLTVIFCILSFIAGRKITR